jgi:predicted Na+-dependent transporter
MLVLVCRLVTSVLFSTRLIVLNMSSPYSNNSISHYSLLNTQIPVLLLHLLGGIVGYWLPKLTGFGEVKSRTMAIETSMKSSAFGFLLAKLHFGDYIARVPSAVSVVWMALTGSLLAVVWRYIPVNEDDA